MKKTLTSAHIRLFDNAADGFRHSVARAREKRSLSITQSALVAQAQEMLGTLGTLLRKLHLQRSLNRAAAQERAFPKRPTARVFPDSDEGRRAHAEYVAAQIEADNRTEYNKAVEAHRRAPFLYE